jgi:hypothetical protein
MARRKRGFGLAHGSAGAPNAHHFVSTAEKSDQEHRRSGLTP